jgi:diguanylate cyclase (GGDEF)-like protein/PAS domain S-box-containing protein
METLTSATAGRRRSDRVSIAFPLEIAGIDSTGASFSERTKTTTVSRYGCCFPLPRKLRPDQKILLRRMGFDETSIGRVVASMGSSDDGALYGVEMRESCEELWGIRFCSSFYEKLLDTMHDGVYIVNRDRKITFWNQSAQEVSGYTAGEVVGRNCFDNLLGHVDESGQPMCTTGCPLSQVIADGQQRRIEAYLRHSSGHRVPVSIRALPLRNREGRIVGAVEVFSRNLDREQTERRWKDLEKLAFRDSLTGLPNRRIMEMKVEHALQEHRRLGRFYGLLEFDLDRFKQVNDVHGHAVGDALLKAVAQTLANRLRPPDIVGRWGGEEFLVLMPEMNPTELGDLAERCRLLIAHSSVAVDTERIAVTASIGATVLNHTDDLESVIRRVDELMYQSKRGGGDRTTAG